MIALSGALTIGQARRVRFRDRIHTENNIDTSLATSLKSNCPNTTGDDNICPLDASTPNTFDNFYYKILLNRKGVLHSDQQLFNGGSGDSQTKIYASDMVTFFDDFSTAMVKMGNIPRNGSSGQIRINCRKVN
uniref:Plant heme peroxidase family profile domain-containing protein n=1 Tax=Arundo donax TaxID=35708 RepID=A0A0A9EC35_ARUDO